MPKVSKIKIVFTGGGTGGHILPIVALAREMRKIYPKRFEFFYIGPKDEFGEIFLSNEGIKIKHILAGKIRRYIDWKSIVYNIIDCFIKIPIGIIQSFFYIFFINPDVIFSKGGFGSIPGVIAGWMLRVPIFLHESDVSPGLANRIVSIFSLKIFVSFPKTDFFSLSKMILVGNPIRRELLEGSREEGKKIFKIRGGKPIILILGGSQGSQRINDRILEILPEILNHFELIHQCGDKNYKEVKNESSVMVNNDDLEKYYHPVSFLNEEELKHAYALCDLILSRAGSGIIFEIAALGKPSILVPLPESAQNHQVKNAYAFAKTGACIVMEENNFTPHFLLEKLKYLFSHPEILEKMKKAAKKFAKPQAARLIAVYLIEFLTTDER